MTSHPACPRSPCRPSRRVPLAALALLVLLAGCGERIDDQRTVPPPGQAAPWPVPVAPVARDLPDIEREGVLRLVATPGPTRGLVFQGEAMGFAVELARLYARRRGLRLELVIPEPGEDPFTLLADGRGDLLAGGRPATGAWEPYGTWSEPLAHTRGVVALAPGDTARRDLASLAGLTVHVPAWSPLSPLLRDLQRRGLRITVAEAPPRETEERLLERLARGEIGAVAVSRLSLDAARCVSRDIGIGPDLTPRRPVCWLLRPNAPALRRDLDRFLRRHYRPGGDARRRSRSLGTLMARYFEDPRQVRYYRQRSLRPDRCGRVSPWDDLVRETCRETPLDWLLVLALIHEESRFDPTVRSEAGAVGLMQVLPRYAGADTDSVDLFDPAVNVRTGVRQLARLYREYAYLDSLDRVAFTLAAYHAGRGHLNDARRLAMDLGLDPDRWRGNVEVGLRLKRDRASLPRTRYGYYRGDETVRYVASILYHRRLYRQFLALHRPGR